MWAEDMYSVIFAQMYAEIYVKKNDSGLGVVNFTFSLTSVIFTTPKRKRADLNLWCSENAFKCYNKTLLL